MSPNLAASVRARLLNVAKAQESDFNQVLVRFALERILYVSHPGRLDADLPSAEARGFLLNSSGF